MHSVLLIALLPLCAALQPSIVASRCPAISVGRVSTPPAMGRAEKRMAKKRQKKGPQYTGGRPINAPGGGGAVREDKLPKSVVATRLGEVPVFGLRGFGLDVQSTETGWLAGDDGNALFYVDAREAERAASKLQAAASLPRAPTVEGVPLDTVYWDVGAVLKASDNAIKQRATVPADRSLVPDVRTPLFCIDGMQTTDKTTGVNSLPMFFSKSELMEFATPVYGAAAADKVLVTDLEVVVVNMLRGPAGPLREAKFFAEAAALTAMDRQEAEAQQSLFPTEAAAPEASIFPGGMKMPWQ